jgi:hypothetical protein
MFLNKTNKCSWMGCQSDYTTIFVDQYSTNEFGSCEEHKQIYLNAAYVVKSYSEIKPYKLLNDGKCGHCSKFANTGKIFSYDDAWSGSKKTIYFTVCDKHVDTYSNDKIYKLVEDDGKKVNPELTVSWPPMDGGMYQLPKPKLVEVPSVPVDEKELSMYHLILRLDRQIYHYTTFARNESGAKEKIIKKFKCQFNPDWIDQVNSLTANKVNDVVQVYER